MNIKKTIIYILIAIPLLLLAKYNESIAPGINPHPTDKMKIYGKTSFGKDCKLSFDIKYAPNNSFGARRTKWIKVPATIKKGSYEVTVYKDHFKQIFSTWKIAAFTPRFQCPGYAQGGIAMLNLSDKSKLTKRYINCTKEQTEKFGQRVTCAVGDTHSIGFEEVSNSQKEIEVDIVDKGLNAPYYELIK